MKIAEFNDLCDREWAKRDRGGRGDVVSVSLTGPSAAELAADILTQPQVASCLLLLGKEEAATVTAGAAVTEIANPITRSTVKIHVKNGGRRETARVRVPGGYRQAWWPASA